MAIRLSENSWHRKIQCYVLESSGSRFDAYRANSLCPYFWLTLFCLVVSPLVFILNLLKKPFNKLNIKTPTLFKKISSKAESDIRAIEISNKTKSIFKYLMVTLLSIWAFLTLGYFLGYFPSLEVFFKIFLIFLIIATALAVISLAVFGVMFAVFGGYLFLEKIPFFRRTFSNIGDFFEFTLPELLYSIKNKICPIIEWKD